MMNHFGIEDAKGAGKPRLVDFNFKDLISTVTRSFHGWSLFSFTLRRKPHQHIHTHIHTPLLPFARSPCSCALPPFHPPSPFLFVTHSLRTHPHLSFSLSLPFFPSYPVHFDSLNPAPSSNDHVPRLDHWLPQLVLPSIITSL